MKEIVEKKKRYIKIKSVKKAGKADVYNMEVEKHHNFAVNGGLIIHNCSDEERYFLYSEFGGMEVTAAKAL